MTRLGIVLIVRKHFFFVNWKLIKYFNSMEPQMIFDYFFILFVKEFFLLFFVEIQRHNKYILYNHSHEVATTSKRIIEFWLNVIASNWITQISRMDEAIEKKISFDRENVIGISSLSVRQFYVLCRPPIQCHWNTPHWDIHLCFKDFFESHFFVLFLLLLMLLVVMNNVLRHLTKSLQ